MTAVEAYFTDVSARLTELATTQSQAIQEVADVGARAIAAKRPIHIFDSGHLISHEFIDRTGGLAAYTALTFSGMLSRGNPWVNSQRRATDQTGEASARFLTQWVIEQGTLQPGDPLIISSVSGTSGAVLELARQARHHGLTVVALTAVDFSSALPPLHSSGKRLHQAADIVLDNRAPYGDAALSVDGVEATVAAWSGIAGAALMWAVTVGIVERCASLGVHPTIYSSYNLPGGGKTYQSSRHRYETEGQ
ncbi:MAG: sugar isomerase domain-containing protein [Microbacteriaceae bacterium]|nr:sugar isomerase domain-containing protein [Microbacteriaceae bacterium]